MGEKEIRWAAVVALCLASLAWAQAGLVAHSDGSRYTLTLDGQTPFHVTDRPIVNERLIGVPGSPAVAAVWDELNQGQPRHMYAISLDGRSLSRVRQADLTIRLRSVGFDPLEGVPMVPAAMRAGEGGEGGLYIVQFHTPAIEAYRQSIRALGGEVYQYMANQAHLVRMTPAVRAEVERLESVRWVGPVHPAYKVDVTVMDDILGGQQHARRYYVKVLEPGLAMKRVVADRIEAVGGVVDVLGAGGTLLQATMTPGQLRRILDMSEVQFVDPWTEPEEDMDIARQIGGADYIEAAGGYSGQGVRAEVMDSGLRTTHVDFQSRPILIHGSNGSDPSHGTSVTGIVFGDGTGSAQARGMLPDSDAIIFSYYGSFSDRWQHTAELVDPAGPYRTVFQTNSWGGARTFNYTVESQAMDELLFDHDIVITQSQSNAGNQDSRPQAWAKNIVSVGGVYHYNTLTKTDDCWCSGGSTGPAADGRIKPDLTHFYDDTYTCSSSGDTAYREFGGTSGATPITAGHFGLIFQMWADGIFGNPVSGGDVFDERPHMTTAKALMINTASQYDFTGTGHDHSRFRQGWGMADVGTLYDLRDEIFVLNEDDVLTELSSQTYQVTVLTGTPEMKVTMVYADPAGNPGGGVARINDLSLRVTSPSGDVYWGNNGLDVGVWSTTGGSSNTVDTVENVFVENPETGDWLVEVLADEINEDGHVETPGLDADYALVVTGGFVEPPALVVRLPDGVPELVAPGDAVTIPVQIIAGSEAVVPGSEMAYYRDDGGSFSAIPLTHMGGISYSATLPGPSCSDVPEFYISAEGDGGTVVTNPPNAPVGTYTYNIGEIITIVADDFENDAGWTVDNQNLSTGAWARVVPSGSSGGRSDPPADADGSGKCWVTGNGFDEDVDGGPTILTTSAYDMTGAIDPTISFALWFKTNDPTSDTFTLEVSDNDGSSWTTVGQLGTTGGWDVQTFRLLDYATLSDVIRLRFSTLDNPNDSVTEAGIDALSITDFVCDDACGPDWNGDTVLDSKDFIAFLNDFVAGNADYDGDTTTNSQDFVAFLNDFVAGC